METFSHSHELLLEIVLKINETESPLGGWEETGESLLFAQIKTQVILNNLYQHVTHKPPCNGQEAAAEYFLFLPPYRRQTGARIRIKRTG